MQGYYQIASFRMPISGVSTPQAADSGISIDATTDEESQESGYTVDYAIVSRRSRDRAGLRYQRRGVVQN